MVKEREDRPYVVNAMAQDAWRMVRILSEFAQGFEALANAGKAVTGFGSARDVLDPRYHAQHSRLLRPPRTTVPLSLASSSSIPQSAF